MSVTLLDGRALSREINQAVKRQVATLSRPPGLGVILVGEDPASQVYVGRKQRVAEALGLLHVQRTLPADITQEALLAELDALQGRDDIDGVLVQLPLPDHLDADAVALRLDPAKDVDGLSPVNAGLLALGRPAMVPCTPAGVMRMLERGGVPLSGKRAVVVGRSNIVGRPIAHLLEQANATVTVCHSRTADLAEEVGRADVIIAAVGSPELVRGAWIRPGAAVIDVGVNRLEDGSLVGDVEFAAAAERAAVLTPVPGGVGPMTIALLMENTLRCALARGAAEGR
ncbi:MAG: bifunctional 5,10-methylenetetrahydrofolate dehydrogenase/5,10-methenyltetrahydrofolate cyclohydrolase [Deltaproteobacteria bacterium]|nr:bifunctional 5,10-methylenetetrahydrofolate dehydrogenase/5,10-methenyltetrahydrofolate cyclohydrolase [Deltaproteobacteria bacterium]